MKSILFGSLALLALVLVSRRAELSAYQAALNATALQGVPVSPTTPVVGDILLFTSGAWTPASLATILPTGNGVCINTTSGALYLCQKVRKVTAVTDTISASDCGGVVVYTPTAAAKAGLSAPTANVPASCPVRIINQSKFTITITPSNALIGGAKTLVIAAAVGPLHPKYAVLYNDGTTFIVGETNN